MNRQSSDRVRYPSSIDPVTNDGRNVDTAIATLTGEAGQQDVKGEDNRLTQLVPEVWDRIPCVTASDTTYYDRPMLKPSVWSIDIPLYYFLGGAAGAALSLGAAIQLAAPAQHRQLRQFSSICHWIGIIGSTAGAGFLIHDLGRPGRFLFMVRVFRPTSPMNVGAWILSGAAPSAIATGLFLNAPGLLGRIGEVCGYISGIFGAALATYTGVLVSSTAIPVWQESRRWMPVLFAASGAATVGSIIDMVYDRKAGRRIAWMFGTAGRLAEIGASLQVERAASVIPKVGEPLHRGRTAILWKTATACTVASLVLSLIPPKSRRKRIAAGVLGAAGSLCMRFAVHYIGNASARDPRAAFQQQRWSAPAQT
jgi:formate-dependent nitrite reductase membrane component NrfD